MRVRTIHHIEQLHFEAWDEADGAVRLFRGFNQ